MKKRCYVALLSLSSVLASFTTAFAEEMNDITDVMNKYGKHDHVDNTKIANYSGGFVELVGTATSFVIMVLFAAVGFTTAADLLYIAVPPLRGLLYQNASGSSTSQFIQGDIAREPQKVSTDSTGKKWCFVSRTMQNLVNAGFTNGNPNTQTKQGSLLQIYFKSRAKELIFLSVVVALFLGSSLFTDFGFNIGQFILDFIFTLIGK